MSKFPANLILILAFVLSTSACNRQPAEPVIDDKYFELLQRHYDKIELKCDLLSYPRLSKKPWQDFEKSLEVIENMATARAADLEPLRPSIPDSAKYADSLARRDQMASIRTSVHRFFRLSIEANDVKNFEKAKEHLKTVEVGFNDASELCEIHKPIK